MKERVFSQFNFTDFFSFLLNNVFAANKPNTKGKKYFLYELSRLPCHKQPHKKKVLNFFCTLGLIYQKYSTKYTRKYCIVFVIRNQHKNFGPK